MRNIKLVTIAACVLGAAIVLYQLLINDKPNTTAPVTAQQNSDDATSQSDTTASLETGATVLKQPTQNIADLTDEQSSGASDSVDNTNSQLSSGYPPLAAYDIGNAPVQDQELVDLVRRLNNDPALLADLITELRAETDPVRLKRLIYILGSTANPAVLPAAEEMIYSGIPGARDTGLDLLSRLAPNNPAAFELAGNLLASETEPDVLVATMNVMAQPAGVSRELRESLVTQVTPLSTHESAKVRSLSVSMVSRLTNNPEVAPVFFNALHDTEPAVRRSGVFAFLNYPYHSAEASQKLLDMAEDASEDKEIRRGAIHVLNSHSPDELTQERLRQAGVQMRQQARQDRINGN